MPPLLKLPAEIKAQWLAWLRDPANKQTSQTLVETPYQQPPHYCCLGGLGKVCGASDVDMKNIAMFTRLRDILASRGTWTKDQHRDVSAVLIQRYEGSPSSVQATLTGMNDHGGKTFPEIATWIEENL